MALIIAQRPGSNSLATAAAIEQRIEELSQDFPKDLSIALSTTTVFVRIDPPSRKRLRGDLSGRGGRAAVSAELARQPDPDRHSGIADRHLSVMLVWLSLNMLSLFGLVLAIGIVVDDAIVVVRMSSAHCPGMPRAASYKAMEEVTPAVIAIAAGLSAVFVPTAFISGLSGQFYRQFALTIAVSTLLSAFNSLTLSPALCALLLRPKGAQPDWFTRVWDLLLGWFFRLFNLGFAATARGYGHAVAWTLRRRAVPLLVYVALIAVTAIGFYRIPTGFIPKQDMGYLITMVQLPDGASVERTSKVVRQVVDIIRQEPGVAHAISYSGYSGTTRSNSPNYGSIFIMGAAYTLSRDGHVRGDFLYRSWKPRTQATVELILYFVFFFPGVLALVFAGWKYASRSIQQGEVSVFSPAGVPVYQFKTILVVAAILLVIQGIAQVFRCILCIREGFWRRAEEDIEETEVALVRQHEDVLRHGSEAIDTVTPDKDEGDRK